MAGGESGLVARCCTQARGFQGGECGGGARVTKYRAEGRGLPAGHVGLRGSGGPGCWMEGPSTRQRSGCLCPHLQHLPGILSPRRSFSPGLSLSHNGLCVVLKRGIPPFLPNVLSFPRLREGEVRRAGAGGSAGQPDAPAWVLRICLGARWGAPESGSPAVRLRVPCLEGTPFPAAGPSVQAEAAK